MESPAWLLQRYKIFRPKANYVKIPVYAGISPVDLKDTNLHQPQIKKETYRQTNPNNH